MIYIVSGFPRTGTSMMMNALAEGGLTPAYSIDRENFLARNGDSQYQPNPKYLEIRHSEYRKLGFPLQYEGKLIKVMTWGLDGMSVGSYRIILMLRDPEEIRQSYEAAFNDKIDVSEYFEKMEAIEDKMLNRKDVQSVHTLSYREVLSHPLKLFESIGWPIECARAARAIDPQQCRFKVEALTLGI